MRNVSRVAVAVAAVASLILVSACGSSSKPAASASGGGNAATGAPINVYFLNAQGSSTAVSFPEATETAQAAVSHINKDLGGINGRPIKMSTCFTDETPATTTKCANEAVAAKPDVIIEGTGSLDNVAATIAEKAGIPFIIYSGSTQASNAFRFTDDQLGPIVAAGILAKQKGLTSLGAVVLDYPIVTNAATEAAPALKKIGIDLRTSLVEFGTADQSAQWQALTSKNPGALMLVEDPNSCVASVKAKSTLGFSGLFIIDAACDSPAVHSAAGNSLDGTLVIASTAAADTTSPDVKEYMTALQKYSPEVVSKGLAGSPNASNSFIDFMTLYQVLKTVKDPSTINASVVTSSFRAAKALPLFMGGGATFTCDGKQVPKLPALCSFVQTYGTYANGKTTYGGSLGDKLVSAMG
jgi:branched-chain amino acid transport system substrate-binding protein